MSILLKDVIDIPERAGAEDYVLRLSDSVGEGHVVNTLDAYVVTPTLVESFDSALALIADSLTTGVSRGAFLTGSFGSGKSHFMAVLHAILRHDPHARAKTELQSVIARHDSALQDKRFLPLPFHLLGAESMEKALFDGYLRQLAQLHPGAPLPALHRSEALLADAARLRERMGEAAFFAGLNPDDDDQWGVLLGPGTGGWNADSYAQALSAAADSKERLTLISALVERYFQAFTVHAEYVDLDTGLAAISTHAKMLGYDAVVLFLDELVLWLAFSVQDREFFRRESQKLTKLVESSIGHRPVPLISFVARQLDLRRWFADAGANGAEQDALDRAFRHQDGRFSQIRLGDDNLPYVAQQRLLRPRDEPSRETMKEAFERLDRRPAVWDVLLDGVNVDEQHRGADELAFRRTYPFSPALVSLLRSLASVMQRERTALKVMQQMLVTRRDSLTVDDLIPVGDAFEFIVQDQGAQVLDPQVAALFRAANALYVEKLHPLLLRPYRLTEADLAAGAEKPSGLAADERLAQTLILSAMAPNVPALKGLTSSRLASLNHGSIVTPLPGNEATMVTGKVREWARHIPEIHIDNEARNPVIRVQLSDVDYESIVDKAKGEDTDGRRRELMKSLVIESFGVQLGSEDLRGAQPYQFVWRGSRREVDVVFGNVRDTDWLPDDMFRAKPDSWRIVIDHPFDEPGHSSAEDVARIDRLIGSNMEEKTIVWLPRFFSEERMRDVRRLVILNWLLDGAGDRWTSHTDHLSEHDRVQARAILESQRSTLGHSMKRAIQVAYEASAPEGSTDVIEDSAHERVLTSLDRGFNPQRPVGASLAAAFENLLQQAFDATYPGHPRFEPGDAEVRVPQLKLVAEHIDRAMADRERRVPLQGDIAAVRRVANPLGVGFAAETHFLFGDDRFDPWGQHFERELGRRGNAEDPVSVRELRAWIEALDPPRGLRPEVADLVVLAWAALRSRAWFTYGTAIDAPAPGGLRPEMELRVQPMPEPEEWSRAKARIGHLFGLPVSDFLTPHGVASVSQGVKAAVNARYDHAFALVRALEESYPRAGLDPAEPHPRLQSAETGRQLVEQLRHLDGVELIRRLGSENSDRDNAIARSLETAQSVSGLLGGFPWERLRPLHEAAQGEGPRADEAAAILGRLRDCLSQDELAAPVSNGIRQADTDLYRWLEAGNRREQGSRRTPEPEATGSRRGRRSVAAHESVDGVLDDLRAFRSAHPDAVVEVEWRSSP